MKEITGLVYVARDPEVKVGFKVISQTEINGRLVIQVLWFDRFGWSNKYKKTSELGLDQFLQDPELFAGEFRYFVEVIPQMPPVWLSEIEDTFDPFASVDITDEEHEFDMVTKAMVSCLFNMMMVGTAVFSIFFVARSVW